VHTPQSAAAAVPLPSRTLLIARESLATGAIHEKPGTVSRRITSVKECVAWPDMGVTTPAIYRYYPSLDALLSALSESVISELCAVVESARDPSGGMAPEFRGRTARLDRAAGVADAPR